MIPPKEWAVKYISSDFNPFYFIKERVFLMAESISRGSGVLK